MCCNPELRQDVIKYKPKQCLAYGTQRTYPSPKMQNGSDRVLRSFNLKSLNKNAGIFNINNNVVGVIKAQNRVSPEETRIEIVSHEGNIPKFNVTAKCVVKKHKPNILGLGNTNSDRTCVRQMLQASNKVTNIVCDFI